MSINNSAITEHNKNMVGPTYYVNCTNLSLGKVKMLFSEIVYIFCSAKIVLY